MPQYNPIEALKIAANSIQEYTECGWDGNKEGMEAITDSINQAIEHLQSDVRVNTAVFDADHAELERLRHGNLTPQEMHRICHNMHETGGCWPVSPKEFARGCELEQMLVFGWSYSMSERWQSTFLGFLVGLVIGWAVRYAVIFFTQSSHVIN